MSAAIDQRSQGRPANDVVYAAQLAPANGNLGQALLQPGAIDVVNAWLDRFQQLGVEGVKISIPYPLLSPTYRASNQYLAFYRQVVSSAEQRRMQVLIHMGFVFANTPFSSISFSYANTTFQATTAAYGAMAQTIVTQLQPDYLTLLSEPDVAQANSGYSEFADPAGTAAFVSQVMAGLPRGSTKLGAGSGSWQPPTFVQALTPLGLDYVNLHIYPIGPQDTANLMGILGAADAAHLPLVMDELWLYKTADQGLGADSPGVFSEDAFTFWQPLDRQFLSMAAALAQRNNIIFMAPFWTSYFFAQTDYTAQTERLSFTQLSNLLSPQARTAVAQGTFTPLGTAYGDIAATGAGCQFVLGFRTLHTLDPNDIGSCTDNQVFAANGDAQQHTFSGLMAWAQGRQLDGLHQRLHDLDQWAERARQPLEHAALPLGVGLRRARTEPRAGLIRAPDG
ncbi:MAG TPA: hypothetical protein VFS62_00935 [Chloroflexota bacterium]|nr:hypothetical protein [Chloroflexota bacterium]